MSDQDSGTLLAALGIAAFARGADGAFAPVTPVPAWFSRLVADPTFPFLGHILEEAGQFWSTHTVGSQEYGPCAEVDETGREFHYKVIAVTSSERQFLVFRQDPDADRMREVLQKARDRALRGGDDTHARSVASLLQKEAQAAADEIRGLLARLDRGRGAGTADVLDAIAARCDRLRACVDSTRI